jgi:hypothetical protein
LKRSPVSGSSTQNGFVSSGAHCTPTPSSPLVMTEIFSSVSGVKTVPPFTTRPMATREEVPNLPANLSWAWMNGWSGHRSRALVSTRVTGPGSGYPKAERIEFSVG